MDYTDWGLVSQLDYAGEDAVPFLNSSESIPSPESSNTPEQEHPSHSLETPSVEIPLTASSRCSHLLFRLPDRVHHTPIPLKHPLNRYLKPLRVYNRQLKKKTEEELSSSFEWFLEETRENEKKKIFLDGLALSFFSRQGQNKKLKKMPVHQLMYLKTDKWNVISLRHSHLNLKGRVKLLFSALDPNYEYISQTLVDSEQIVCFQFFFKKNGFVNKTHKTATLEIHLDDICCYQRNTRLYPLGSSSNKVKILPETPASQLFFCAIQQHEKEKKWLIRAKIEKSGEQILVDLLREANVSLDEIIYYPFPIKGLKKDCSQELFSSFRNRVNALMDLNPKKPLDFVEHFFEISSPLSKPVMKTQPKKRDRVLFERIPFTNRFKIKFIT